MVIKKTSRGDWMEISLSGRLDTNAALDLAREMNPYITENVQKVIFEFEDLEYISSEGLRVILLVQKKMNQQGGSMVIRHPNSLVTEVLDATGFKSIMIIEP